MSIQTLFQTALEEFRSETPALEFLPEQRYDEAVFPTTGQYDWFSGQLLYCLIRHTRPERILEISTASGYATMFMALALKKNGTGRIDTFEMDRHTASSSQALFRRHGLGDIVRLHIGDARKTSRRAEEEYDIYFLDSLHTEAFARWFIETHVMKCESGRALFHMHDILPRHARLRCWNAPPIEGTPLDENFGMSWGKRIKRYLRKRWKTDRAENERTSLCIHPPAEAGGLQTYDGNSTTEAAFGNDLASRMNAEDHVFLHDLADRFPDLLPQKYSALVKGRADRHNIPMEWNESWWCKVPALKKAYRP